jgi:hypothetical protein
MTLDRVVVDLSRVFAVGQAYVALSRCRSLEGLQMLGFSARKILTSTKVGRVQQSRSRPARAGAFPAATERAEVRCPPPPPLAWAQRWRNPRPPTHPPTYPG